jgi:hypothetical protein
MDLMRRNMKKILGVLGFLIGFAFGSEPLIGKGDYTRLDFTVVKRSDSIPPSVWEKEKFGLVEKNRLSLKSRFAAPQGKKWRYRFVVEQETYPDSARARVRLDSLFVKPPKLRPEDNKAFPLRTGFVVGDKVVIIRTDVAGYQILLGPLAEALEIVAKAPDPTSKRVLADSLSHALKNASSMEIRTR